MYQQDQEIFKILLETISEGVIIVDSEHKIVDQNSASQDIFGYTRKELVGKDLNTLIPSNFHKVYKNQFKTIIKNGKRIKMSETKDIYGLKKDGIIINIDAELIPFKVYNKTFVMGVFKDISEKKEIERNLMLRTKALQSAQNGIVITDALEHDNPIIFFNKAFQDLTGYSEKEIINRNCRFLQRNDRDQEPLKKLKEAIEKGESCQATLRNYKKNGTMFWNDLYVFPITDSDGVLTNFIGIQNDVTDKIEQEEERHHLGSIFDESLNEIYVFDAKTLKFLNVNFGAQQNLGYNIEELKDMTILDIKPPDNSDKFKETLPVLLKQNVEKIKYENVHRRKDGSTYPVEVHLQRSKLHDKDVFIAIVLDITERKNYTEKLENQVEERTQQLKKALSKEKELNEIKTNFLSMVSHEFKTPLSAILTSGELLRKYAVKEHKEKREKHIKTIIDKVYYLNNIINDFLSLEKLETGKVNYRFTHFKLSKVIDQTVYDANMLLKKGQQIKYPQNIDDFSVYQDEKIIHLILSNLLHNAIKYSKEGSSINLKIKQDKQKTIITVSDQGIGIPEKDQKHIFERYFRAQNVINTQGNGIGLNIVKTHLENLGGSIYFESEEGKGTTFEISIPNTHNA
ncbi:PAS domain S-box protein [Gaetbulibacter sp. M240]|uniref:PAS domain-containing sensor histidine kinase n=1 Tax=Gaetbulibacter sp. M240 TaxID=3126511 RepID=UPI00374E5586